MTETKQPPSNRPPKGPRDPVAGPDSGPESPFPIKLSGPVIKGFGRGSRELGIPTANIPPPPPPSRTGTGTGTGASGGDSDQLDLVSGVYFGFVGLRLAPHTVQSADNSKLTLSLPSSSSTSSTTSTCTSNSTSNSTGPGPGPETQVTSNSTSVYPAVLSIGYNPYYKNETRSIEIHILHHFPHYNFYYSPLNLLILGFIRPEYDYDSLEALVDDIKTDCQVARTSLQRPQWAKWAQDERLTAFDWVDSDQASSAAEAKKVEAEVIGGPAAAAAAAADRK